MGADRPYTPVAVQDVCRAAGAVLRDPETHAGRTYHLASHRFSLGDLAEVEDLSPACSYPQGQLLCLSRFVALENFVRIALQNKSCKRTRFWQHSC